MRPAAREIGANRIVVPRKRAARPDFTRDSVHAPYARTRWLAERFETPKIVVAPASRRSKDRPTGRRSTSDRNNDDSELAALLEQLEDHDVGYESRQIELTSGGLADAGALVGGVQLPRHAAYRLIDPSRAWGTPGTISSLIQAFDEIVAIDPTAPRVEVHDLSLARGGKMHGHKSHRTGRDVDITYYQRGRRGTCLGRRLCADDLDALREWRLLRHWLEHAEAEFIFIDYTLQRPLYEAAKASGASQRHLLEWFQYPRRPEIRAGIIRHVANHVNHVHVRFRGTGVRARSNSALGDDPESELREMLEE